jgi:hypothetical protein
MIVLFRESMVFSSFKPDRSNGSEIIKQEVRDDMLAGLMAHWAAMMGSEEEGKVKAQRFNTFKILLENPKQEVDDSEIEMMRIASHGVRVHRNILQNESSVFEADETEIFP